MVGGTLALCAVWPALAQEPPVPTATTPVGTGGTSNGADFADTLKSQVQAALKAQNLSLENKNGFHWVFLVQVAEYPSFGDVRFSDRARGIKYFIQDTLMASRRTWSPEERQDTINIVPYHFNLVRDTRDRTKFQERLDLRGRRQSLLTNYLAEQDVAKLFALIPDKAQPDVYGDGKLYKDGHDWRRALAQTVGQLQKLDFQRNAVVIVLDWNAQAQVPKRLANAASGTPEVAASDQWLMKPEEADYVKTLGDAGFNPARTLVPKRVGSFDYEFGVFVPRNLEPLGDGGATPIPAGVPTEARPTAGGGDNSLLWIFLGLIAIAVGVVCKISFEKHAIRLDDRAFALQVARDSTVNIVGPNGRPGKSSYVLSQAQAPLAGPEILAQVKVAPRGRLLIGKRSCTVRGVNGCKPLKDGSLEITKRTAQFSLINSAGQEVAQVRLRRA